MMGLTYANKDDFAKAAEYFERAKTVLENTIGIFTKYNILKLIFCY
jgi:hypothetical protein